jgi:hypothetical protein
MDLIERDGAAKIVRRIAGYYSLEYAEIKNLPAVDAAPIIHAKWIMRGGKFRCSNCDGKAKWDKNGGTGGWSSEYTQVKTAFCPYCGAIMDGGKNDGSD